MYLVLATGLAHSALMDTAATPSAQRSSSGSSDCLQIRDYTHDVPAPRPGDVVFGNRLSPVQRLNTLSGDSLTHCGVVVMIDGQLQVAELGARGCFFRPLPAFRAAYRVTGIGHSAMSDECRNRFAARAIEVVEQQALRYSWANVGLAGTMALMRRMVPDSAQAAWIKSSTRVAARLLDRVDSHAVTCSGLVVHCFGAACDNCRPYLVWPHRQRVAPWRGATTPTDARDGVVPESVMGRVAHALSTPSDLWVATTFPQRTVLDARATVLIRNLSAMAHQERGPCLFEALHMQAETSRGGAR